MPVAIDGAAKSFECSVLRLSFLTEQNKLSHPQLFPFSLFIYLMRPLLDAWGSARVGKLLPKKRASPLLRIHHSMCNNNSFVKVFARHMLSAWIECWLCVSGIAIFPCFINCCCCCLGLLSSRSRSSGSNSSAEKSYKAAARFYFSISTDSLNPESCHDYFYDYTRALFAVIFKHFIVCERVGAQCSSSNNKSAHQHH